MDKLGSSLRRNKKSFMSIKDIVFKEVATALWINT